MIKVYMAPDRSYVRRSVFLAGSIEMGNAIDWQKDITEKLAALNTQIDIYNPRRLDWDSTWEQNKDNDNFREQVEWELEALENANLIILYFDPNTKSPISLLELGLHARSGKLVVICPEGFWRKGNVDVTCEFYGVIQVPSIEAAIDLIKQNLGIE